MSFHLFTRRSLAALCLIFLTLSGWSSLCSAYTLTTTSSGQTTRWPYGQKLFLAGNPTGRENFDPDFFRKAVINGLQQWNWATGGMFDFDYWQGTDPNIYEANLDQNGLSSIFFASNSTVTTDPNVIGFTQVWFNNDTGNMIEADVMLNDRNYELTTNPTDTSSNGIGPTGLPQVYISNIITHELGHAIGLSHAGNINSTMLYVEYSGQDQIACDDWSAARHLYPSAGSNTGSVTGTIASPSGTAIPGALVIAVSKERGTPLASVHTDQNGSFNFGALEAGEIALMVEPFQGSPNSVPARVQAKSSDDICSGNYYPPNFFTTGDGHTLEEYTVTAGSNTNVGTFHLSCTSITDSQTLYAQTTAPDMLVDVNQYSVNKNYQFQANGPFKITGIGYLVLSSVKVSIAVTDAEGNPITVQTLSPLYQADSNFTIVDSQVTGQAYGLINVQVTTSLIPDTAYPTPSFWPSAIPYFMITFDGAPTSPNSPLPANARCAPPTSFSAYQSPPGNPITNASSDTTRSSAGFCGNANAATLHGRKTSHRSVPWESVFSWFFPLLTALFTQLYFKSRAARLKATCVTPL